MMGLGEAITADGQLTDTPPRMVPLFGTPAFIYRELLAECGRWALDRARGRESQSFKHENRVRYLIGYISKRYEQEFASRKGSHLLEVGRFVKAMFHKKFHLSSARLLKRL